MRTEDIIYSQIKQDKGQFADSYGKIKYES